MRYAGCRRSRAHPRSHGENPFDTETEIVPGGSSPLTRGNIDLWAQIYLLDGSSPLTRGKPHSQTRSRLGQRAHPRSRGENGKLIRQMSKFEGSSPLTRGKRVYQADERQRPGLIPAHAGKTVPSGWSTPIGEAHPRSRGENASPSVSGSMILGSSPLTRGKQ